MFKFLITSLAASSLLGLQGTSFTQPQQPQQQGASELPTPCVTTPKVKPASGWPAVMPSGTSAIDVGVKAPRFPFEIALPQSSAAERQAAPPEVRRVLAAMDNVGPRISLATMYEIFPALKNDGVWVSQHPWQIGRDQGHGDYWSKDLGRMNCFLGAGFYKLPLGLSEVRRRERDYCRQKPALGYDVIYPVKGSYVIGSHNGDPYTMIETFSTDSSWWYSWSMHFVVFERRVGGRLTVDYADKGADTLWAAGRDVWVEVWDGEQMVGHLCFTEFGMDIKDVPDKDSDVREAILNAHQFMLKG